MIGILYTTVASKEEAENLATSAIEAKMAACVNIFPGVISIYPWEGKIEHAEEYAIIFKTTTTNLLPLKEWVIQNHPYKVPAIVILDAESSDLFQSYISSEVKGE